MALVALVALAACHGFHRRPKSYQFRALEVGSFAGYKIEVCPSGGHVVRRLEEPDERGEAGSRERIDTYRNRYLVPKLDMVDIRGWAYQDKCAHGGLSLVTPNEQQGEALHRIGAVLKATPTDIEVTVVPEH